jgi:integrase
VIGASGALTGYGGGLARKTWLIDHEPANAAPGNAPPARGVETGISSGELRSVPFTNRHKPSGIAGKATVFRAHLLPALGDKRLNAITNEDVQALKLRLKERSPKTVNNVLTVLSVLLKKAVEWEVIDSLPCAVRLLTIPKGTTARFYDFQEIRRVVEAAMADGRAAHLIALLGGEAGLRRGEMMALEWLDVDVVNVS